MQTSKETSLKTNRLVLRPWKMEDAPALYELAKDPEIGPKAGWLPHRSVNESAQVIKEVFSAPRTFAMVERETNRVVGAVGLNAPEISQVAGEGEMELGYWVGTQYQGKGYATEASQEVIRYGFENLQLRVIWATYFSDNEASRRVQEKLGFTFHHTFETYDEITQQTRMVMAQKLQNPQPN